MQSSRPIIKFACKYAAFLRPCRLRCKPEQLLLFINDPILWFCASLKEIMFNMRDRNDFKATYCALLQTISILSCVIAFSSCVLSTAVVPANCHLSMMIFWHFVFSIFSSGLWKCKDSPQQQLQPLRQVHPGQLPGEWHRQRVSQIHTEQHVHVWTWIKVYNPQTHDSLLLLISHVNQQSVLIK